MAKVKVSRRLAETMVDVIVKKGTVIPPRKPKAAMNRAMAPARTGQAITGKAKTRPSIPWSGRPTGAP